MDSGESGHAASDCTAKNGNSTRAHDLSSSLRRNAPPLPPPFYVPKSNEGDEGVYDITHNNGRAPSTKSAMMYGEQPPSNLFSYRKEPQANGSAERFRGMNMFAPGHTPFITSPPDDCQSDPAPFETESLQLFKQRTPSSEYMQSNHATSVVSSEDIAQRTHTDNIETACVQGEKADGDASRPQDGQEAGNTPNTQATVPPLKPPEISARSFVRIAHLMGRLCDLEDRHNIARSKYRDLRKQFVKRRKRLNLAQKRLFEAQLGGGDGPKSSIVVDGKIANLVERHAAAHKDCQSSEKSLERAEKRAERIELKKENLQEELFRLLKPVVSELVVDGDSVASNEGSVTDSTDSNVASDSPSEDQPALVREYYDAVGRVNILRERLNEFEIGHQSRMSNRESAFEALVTEGKPPLGYLRQAPEDGNILKAWFRAYRSFLDEYFNERAIMARELLDARRAAEASKTQYSQETKQTPEESDEPDALKEAIKYNLEGPIGSMYALHHEGKHLGVRPIDLVTVPFLHWQDRVDHWLVDMLIETRTVPKKDGLDPAEYAEQPLSLRPLFRTFVPYYDVLVRDDRKLTQASASATDFKPSHIITAVEDDSRGPAAPIVPMHNVYTSRVQWTCWSGECELPARPHSMPDLGLDATDIDHFASWAETERPTLDWRRDMLTV